MLILRFTRCSDDIYEEVPIRIHNSALVNAMLYDWVCEGTMGAKMDCDFERLDLSSRPFLEKAMEQLLDGVENLRQDQDRAEFKKRDAERKRRDFKRKENYGREEKNEELLRMFPDPSRLEGLLIANQVRVETSRPSEREYTADIMADWREHVRFIMASTCAPCVPTVQSRVRG